jgi:hypothetical protein
MLTTTLHRFFIFRSSNMADYYFPTVVQQVIPIAHMTPLERLILQRMFDFEPDGDGLYFFSNTGPRDFFDLPVATLKAAFAQSTGTESALRGYLANLVAGLGEATTHAEIDLSLLSYEPILQDIVRRSRALAYVTVVTAFTCSKMRPDGFGGMATIITAEAVRSKSTYDILDDFIGKAPASLPMPA